MSEIWRDIEGYEGLYQVSTEGGVKSLNYRHTGREKIMKSQVDGFGYLHVMLYKDSKSKQHHIHRLVASAFIPNHDSKSEVNHKDEDKTNNNVDNLEWCTHKENCNYGTRNERVAEAQRGVYNTKLSIPVDMFTKEGEFIRQFPSSMEAERWLRANGYPKAGHSHISQCCKGKLNTHCGFKWKYAQGN